MIKAIIFDCFGVLITDVLQVLKNELAVYDVQGAADIKGIVAAANLGIISRDESNAKVAEILGISVADYRAKISGGEARDDALFSYIVELRKIYKTAMLSNISVDSLERRFTKAELDKYFDEVIVSGEVGFAKPSPEIYEIAADRLGLRCDECVFVDDRDMFVEAARGVGMNAFVYTDFQEFRTQLSDILG